MTTKGDNMTTKLDRENIEQESRKWFDREIGRIDGIKSVVEGAGVDTSSESMCKILDYLTFFLNYNREHSDQVHFQTEYAMFHARTNKGD